MKRFVIEFAVFILILVGSLSIYLTFLFNFNVKLIEDYKFEKNKNKLVAGDSRTQYSIDDKLLANTQNVSQNGEGLLYTYFKLKTLLMNNPQIDTVLLGVSYHSFSSYYDDIIRKPDVSSRYFFILPAAVQLELLKDTKNTFPTIQKSIIAGTKNWLRSTPDYTFIGGFDSYSSKISLSNELINRRIHSQFFDNEKLNDFSVENILYFSRIVEICKDLNVKLIVLNTPMNARYKENVPPKFINEFNNLVKNNQIGVIEFDDLKLNENDFLPDGDHLQESGARLATLYLNSLLNKPGKH